jgi:DNA polymerase III delta subunit
MDYAAFKKELERGTIRPAYFFVGEEEYLIDAAEKAIVQKALKPEDRMLNLCIFYGGDTNGLQEALVSVPVFAPFRVTAVRQARDLKQNDVKAVISYLKTPPQDGCLILLLPGKLDKKKSPGKEPSEPIEPVVSKKGKPEKRKSIYDELAGHIEPIVCKKLSSGELGRWLKERLKQHGKKIDDHAFSLIQEVNWPTLRELFEELDRLIMLVGDREQISAEDVRELGKSSFAFERWSLTDAVGLGDVAAASEAVKNLQYWNMKPVQIIYDLFRMFHRLWLVNWFIKQRKLDQARQVVNVHAFVFKKLVDCAGRVDRQVLESGLLRIYEADVNIKQGLRQPEQEVNLLALELAQAIRTGRR